MTSSMHRHKKRGSEYELIGYGKMQAEHWYKFELDQSNPDRRNIIHGWWSPYRGFFDNW